MFQKILLLDTNPLKIKGHQNWFDSIKNSRQFSNIEYGELCVGLKEAKSNFDLISKENAFVTPDVYKEFKSYYDLIFQFHFYFQKNNGNKLKGTRAKENKYLYDQILHHVNKIDRSFENSIYDLRNYQDYSSLEQIVKIFDRESRKETGKDYSPGDVSLITTSLLRSAYGKETSIVSPDSDMHAILKKINERGYDFNNHLIKVEYTYFRNTISF